MHPHVSGDGGARADDFDSACGRSAPSLATYFRRELLSDLGSCLIIAIALSLVVAPFMDEGSFTWVSILFFNSIVSLCIGLTVSNTFRFLLPPLRRRLPGAAANVVLHLVLGLASTALGVEIAIRLIEALGGMAAADLRASVLRVGLVVVAIAIGLNVTYERLRSRARRDEMRAEQAHKEALRAQLKALQARTNPHFLFNSLNTVSGLIEDDPAGAEKVLAHLSELFRYALKGAEGGWVRLGDEVGAVESYLEVESIRLGDRLRSRIDVPTELRDTLVPPLILQPLVENAVLHGVAPRRSGGRVEITARRHDGKLRLSITDDGDGPGSSRHQGSGTSLVEMRQRLDMLYGRSSRLEAGERNDDDGYRVEVTMPVDSPV